MTILLMTLHGVFYMTNASAVQAKVTWALIAASERVGDGTGLTVEDATENNGDADADAGSDEVRGDGADGLD